MKVILRYGKVNAINGRKVTMTGVNPQTGKNISFVFSSIDNKKTLEGLTNAFHSKILLQFSAAEKKGEIGEFQREAPAENREDSYFTLLTYCSKVNYNPVFLRELDHHLVTMQSSLSPVTELGGYLLNVADKLGNIFYARDRIAELELKGRPLVAEIRYHITNAIVSCKACIEAFATILNVVYGIGYTKGNIDLATTRSDFLQKVADINPKLGAELRKYEKWINEVTEYRNSVIHRIMLLTPPITSKDVAGVPKTVRCRVPSSPLAVGDKDLKGIDWIDAEKYCHFLIEQLKRLIEIVCVDLLGLIESGTYYPV